MKELVQYLKINGKIIHFQNREGKIWIAIKPICMALGVNFQNQFKSIKSDPVLGPEVIKMQFRYPDQQRRLFTCLPERFVYGWLFGMRSRVESFQIYKWKCYEILFEHFRGQLAERQNILLEKLDLQERRFELEKELSENNPNYCKLNQIKGQELRIGKELKELDKKLVESPDIPFLPN